MADFNPITNIEGSSGDGAGLVKTKSNWVSKYKEAFVQHHHDTSQLILTLPDDCLMVVGPERLRQAGSGTNGSEFYPVGYVNSIQITETRQVQPLKAIGSRRHIFAATNSPVQISIGRMMLLGVNLLRALYANTTVPKAISADNSTQHYSSISATHDSSYFFNIEEDLYRIPIGIGIIYNSPSSLAGKMTYTAGAHYFEVCTIVNCGTQIQSGQAMIMEQVTLMADRAIAWDSLKTMSFTANSHNNPAATSLGGFGS